MLSKKGTIIFYYDFCKVDEVDKILEKINKKALESGNRIKILNKKSAGEIAPYKIRIRVDFKVL
jgi:tRNA G37 N-methylase Trm5